MVLNMLLTATRFMVDENLLNFRYFVYWLDTINQASSY
jgi:hypothetical protein